MEPIDKNYASSVAHLQPYDWRIALSDAYLQGHMGWSLAEQDVAAIVVGDFVMLWGAGTPASRRTVLEETFFQAGRRGLTELHVIPSSADWRATLARIWAATAGVATDSGPLPGFHPYIREVFEAGDFDAPAFHEFAAAVLNRAWPGDLEVRPMDPVLAERLAGLSWCNDAVKHYESTAQAAERSVAAVALIRREIVAVAGCYTVYDDGIEVEIDTHRDFRRRGLASRVAVEQIRMCRERGLVAHWDAFSPVSAEFARKLGFRNGHRYECIGLDLKEFTPRLELERSANANGRDGSAP